MSEIKNSVSSVCATDDYARTEMVRRKIPALSIAVLRDERPSTFKTALGKHIFGVLMREWEIACGQLLPSFNGKM
jgi:hypothetical protein